MPAMTPPRWAIAYAVASVALGPVLLVLGYVLFTRGGGDFCDSVYQLPGGSFDSSRDREFRHAQMFQVIGASVMLLVGVGVLTVLARRRAAIRGLAAILSAVITVVMMLGYVEVIRGAGEIFQTTC